MRFFFLDGPPPLDFGDWDAPRELIQHLRALRFSPSEEFVLVVPGEQAWLANFRFQESKVELKGPCALPQAERLPIVLFTAWPKGKRAEALVTRAVEAGVSAIVPLVCERSVAGREPLSANQKTRLQRLVLEVAQQLRDPAPLRIQDEPVNFQQALEAPGSARRLILHPNGRPLLQLFEADQSGPIHLFVGPEGGFSTQEAALASDLGAERASLGDRILRIEAAGPTAAACLQLAALP